MLEPPKKAEFTIHIRLWLGWRKQLDPTQLVVSPIIISVTISGWECQHLKDLSHLQGCGSVSVGDAATYKPLDRLISKQTFPNSHKLSILQSSREAMGGHG